MDGSSFDGLLLKDNSWTVHENNIHTLLTELSKYINSISPPKIQEFCNLRFTPYSKCTVIKTAKKVCCEYGSNSI